MLYDDSGLNEQQGSSHTEAVRRFLCPDNVAAVLLVAIADLHSGQGKRREDARIALRGRAATRMRATLSLSGEDDVRTPPSFGAQVARALRHAYALTVLGTGHVLGGRQTCAPQIERAFVCHPHQKPDGRRLGPLLGASIFDRVH